MLTHVRPAIVMMVLHTALTGVIYPLAMTGVAQVLMPSVANGSMIERGSGVVGSELIGQVFTSDKYFQGRPSATSAPDPKDATKTVDLPYNAANSGGSNLGPLSKKLIERVEGDVVALRKAGAGIIPADAVTTSASGLDPHITQAHAAIQIVRVAAARKVSEARVRAIVDSAMERPFVGFLGEWRLNVLKLNLILDATLPGSAG